MKFEKHFENIKMIISDFDGIFTDGKGIIDAEGNVSKKIHYHDVIGIGVAIKSGLKVVIITGEKAGAVQYLSNIFAELKTFQGIKDKLPIVKQLAEENDLKPENILYIGDDINDFQAINYCGIRVTVPNANQYIKSIPNIILTEKQGGEGVLREVIDTVLQKKLKEHFVEKLNG